MAADFEPKVGDYVIYDEWKVGKKLVQVSMMEPPHWIRFHNTDEYGRPCHTLALISRLERPILDQLAEI